MLMNAADVVMYGQGTFLAGLDSVPQSEWDLPDVCGYWSVRQIVTHIASYEAMFADVLASITGNDPTPTLDAFRNDPAGFNDAEVERRADLTTDAALAELKSEHERVMSLIREIPPKRLSEPGTIPWYGPEYSVDDLIAYQVYGHKREHAAQICVFADHLKLAV
jgi:uncharacterized protein (TIGR03083 family)